MTLFLIFAGISLLLLLITYWCYRFAFYAANPKNQAATFTLPASLWGAYSQAAMNICEANCQSILSKEENLVLGKQGDVKQPEISTASLAQQYPLFTSSLLNLIQSAEQKALQKK